MTTNARLGQQLEEARHDDLLPEFFNLFGMKHLIETDAELRRELLEGRCGVLRLDVRGLKFVNDLTHHGGVSGEGGGNDFLRLVGARVMGSSNTSPLVRLTPRSTKEGDEPVKDLLFFRPHGDELGTAVRRVTPENLQIVGRRVSNAFSVARGIQEGRNSMAPIIGNVGAAHASELTISDSEISLPPGTSKKAAEVIRAKAIFDAVSQEADARSTGIRRQQYQEMLNALCEDDPTLPLRHNHIVKDPQSHTSSILKLFFERFCPAFLEDPEGAIQRSLAQR
ncbi:MAG TPA: hypothetical protein VLG11_01750 [Candidatus Saccharimonadales bacterium]|nr:hypothetical protein [Candidatus Saccharimonadales bacterium]